MNKNIILEIDRNLELMGIKTSKFLIKENVVPIPALKVITAPIVKNYLRTLSNIGSLIDLVPATNRAIALTKLNPIYDKTYAEILQNTSLKTQFDDFIKEVSGEKLALKSAELDSPLKSSIDTLKKSFYKDIQASWGEEQLTKYQLGMEKGIDNFFDSKFTKNATPEEKEFYDALKTELKNEFKNNIQTKIDNITLDKGKNELLDELTPKFTGKTGGTFEKLRPATFELLNTYWLNWLRIKYLKNEFEFQTKKIAQEISEALKDPSVHPYFHLRKLVFRFLPDRPLERNFEEAFLKWSEKLVPPNESYTFKNNMKIFLTSERVQKDLGDLFSDEYSKTREGLKIDIIKSNFIPWCKLVSKSPINLIAIFQKKYGSNIVEWFQRLNSLLARQTPLLPEELKKLYGAKTFRQRLMASASNKILRFSVIPLVLAALETVYDVIVDRIKNYKTFLDQILNEEKQLRDMLNEIKKLKEDAPTEQNEYIKALDDLIVTVEENLGKMTKEREELQEHMRMSLGEKFQENFLHWFPIWFSKDPYKIGDDNFLKYVNSNVIRTPFCFTYYDEFLFKVADKLIDFTTSQDDINKIMYQTTSAFRDVVARNNQCVQRTQLSTNLEDMTRTIQQISECVLRNNPQLQRTDTQVQPPPQPVTQKIEKYLDGTINPEYKEKATPDETGFKWFLDNDYGLKMYPNSFKNDDPPVAKSTKEDGTEGDNFYFDRTELWKKY